MDEYKIALHLESKVRQFRTPVDYKKKIRLCEMDEIDLGRDPLLNEGKFYLGFSIQRLSLPQNTFGMLHTRSSIARMGLDFFGSSTYVSPGFGAELPTQIVFEIRPAVTVLNLPLHRPVAGLLLFEMDDMNEVWRGRGKHAMRFPFVDYLPEEVTRDDEKPV